jgi:hypothetical protein
MSLCSLISTILTVPSRSVEHQTGNRLLNGTVNRKYFVLDCVFIVYRLAKCVAHNFHKQTESMDRLRTAAILLFCIIR